MEDNASIDLENSPAYRMLVRFYTEHPEGIAIARRWRNQRLKVLGRRVCLAVLVVIMVAS